MSATTATVRELPRRSRTPGPEPTALKVLELSVGIPVVAFLAFSLVSHWKDVTSLLPGLIAWVLVIAIADLVPVPIWRTVEITVSFPVLLASAMVFPPYVACFLGFVGPVDLRELRRNISWLRGLFNRANIALSVLAASYVFHLAGGDFAEWPWVLAPALLALGTDVLLNGLLVTVGTHLLTGVPAPLVWRHISGGGVLAPFLLGYVAVGLFAILLATAFNAAGDWALLVFAVPVFLARQTFLYWKRLAEAAEQLAAKNRALAALTEQVVEERRDERRAIAAGIHDEVLPALFKVHLMGQVLRQDLASGRLLELEDDLPDLMLAVDTANGALRELVRGLRLSPLGPGGLAGTIRLLTRQMESVTSASFQLELEDVGGSPLTQMLAYQVAREAIANAVRHSGASSIRVSLGVLDGAVRLVVQDDGRGFTPGGVDGSRHFGLQLMRERAELSGGAFALDSVPGEGTIVVARFPIETAGAEED